MNDFKNYPSLHLHNKNNTETLIVCGHCVQVMEGWQKVDPPVKFNLIFADPPFNIDQNYDTHVDTMSRLQFRSFTFDWIRSAWQFLVPGGIFVVNIPDSMVRLVLECFDGTLMERIDWIIWHYRFGNCVKTKFISSHTHLLVFRNGPASHTFNANDIMIDSLRATLYNDPRTEESQTPGKRVPCDVWVDIPRVTGNAKERMPSHPNQLPEKLLERIILAYSNPGDSLFDPFGGTGTTVAVAARLGRNGTTCEISPQYCVDIERRVEKG